MHTRTQKPKLLALIYPVVTSTEIQLVINIETYMDAMHI